MTFGPFVIFARLKIVATVGSAMTCMIMRGIVSRSFGSYLGWLPVMEAGQRRAPRPLATYLPWVLEWYPHPGLRLELYAPYGAGLPESGPPAADRDASRRSAFDADDQAE